MLAQGHTETEIAQILHVHVSTIRRDVKALKQLSQHFVFDLAKGNLTYYYKQCIDGIDEIRREAWSLYKSLCEKSASSICDPCTSIM